nr:EamA family transporter [Sneathiella chinensis]
MFLCLLALLWGSSFMLMKISLQEIPPVTLIAIRVSIATLFLFAIASYQRLSLPPRGKIWGALYIQGFLNSFGAWFLLAWGQQFVDTGLAGVLNSTSPIFVCLITLLFMRQVRLGGRKIAGAFLGLAGVVLIIGLDALAGLGEQVLAQIAILSAAVLYGAAALYGQRFIHLSPTMTAAITSLWGLVTLVPLSLVIDRPWTLEYTALPVLSAVCLGVLNTGVAMLVYYRLIRTLGPVGVASQAYLRAGVSVILGVTLLGETLTLVIGTGLMIAVFGVVLINLPDRRKDRRPPPASESPE